MSGESGYCSEFGQYAGDEEEIPEEEADYIKAKVLKKDVRAVVHEDIVNVEPEVLHQTRGINSSKAEEASKPETQRVKKITKKGGQAGASSTRLVLSQIVGKPWYHGKMERNEAETILAGTPALTFLVRHSYKLPVAAKDGYLRNR